MTRANLYVPVTARRGSIAIGNFDGVHRGHAEMLQRLKQMAIATASHAVAVTFDPHPIAILRPEFTPPILTTLSERITLLKESGAAEVVVLPVTQQLLEMTAEQFFTEVIVEQFEARGIVEGPNFHFGKDRHGDTLLLQSLCDTHGIQCHVVKPVVDGDLMISSSRIRELLCSRAMTQATELLGHPYRLSGVVKQGAQRGRTIGFPTANLTDIPTLLPAHGVYAGLTQLDGRWFPVAASIGPNPTFGEHREKIECHIDGYEGDLYGKILHVDLLSEVRALQSFSSIDLLISQIQSDVAYCRRTAQQFLAKG